MPNTRPPLALVTGGSSGIGLELARCAAADGCRLILVARDPARLEQAAASLRTAGAASVECWSLDLAAPRAGVTLFDRCRDAGAIPDYLMLNAGTGALGDFVGETDLALEREAIAVNIASVVDAAKHFLPAMAARGSGRLLITSSIVAFGPSPRLAVYSGTKAFLYAFAEALRDEVARHGITVTALMPDLTETRFFVRAHAEDSRTAHEPKASPRTVAHDGYAAMLRGADHVVTPITARLKTAAAALLPPRLAARLARAV